MRLVVQAERPPGGQVGRCYRRAGQPPRGLRRSGECRPVLSRRLLGGAGRGGPAHPPEAPEAGGAGGASPLVWRNADKFSRSGRSCWYRSLKGSETTHCPRSEGTRTASNVNSPPGWCCRATSCLCPLDGTLVVTSRARLPIRACTFRRVAPCPLAPRARSQSRSAFPLRSPHRYATRWAAVPVRCGMQRGQE